MVVLDSETDFPYCVTGIMTQDGNEFTAFRCGKDFLSGETALYPDTSMTVTQTVDGEATTVFVTSDDSPSGTGDADQGAPDGDSKDEGNSGGGGSNDTPVGAIVGGVIGGVALILLIAFGIWFIRFQRRKTPDRNASAEAYRHTDMMSGYASPPQQQPPIYGYPPTSIGYAESMNYAGTGYAGSSPPPEGYYPPQTVMAEAPDPSVYGASAATELPTQK